ncbi:MAG: SurA N-terminal domain-containing protein [Betaproteobacteria bacterium]|nr:SurA N-terminal domain-containing protein [Betaproteobacteria bacterium]
MFDAIRNSKRIIQFFLVLIIISFSVWGLESYFRGGGGDDLVQIGKTRIGMNAFRDALRNEQERQRRANPHADPAEFDSQATRDDALNSLINRYLLLLEAQKQGLNVRLAMQQLIAQIPDFQENGVFSQERYEATLAAMQRPVQEFESEFQEGLLRQTLLSSVLEASFAPKTVTNRIIALLTETRDVQEHLIAWRPLVSKVKISDAEVRQFYDDNPANFSIPEQIQVEYVLLAQGMLGSMTKIPEADLRAWYEINKERFAKRPEERRISHILLITDADKEKVHAEAMRLLSEVQKEPGRFAELAKAHSEDPGSAGQGGDLGFMTRQMLVKSFADAAFSLKKGDISDLVESEFGFHIIRVDDILPGEYFPFAEVRPHIEEAMREQNMARLFAEAAENFKNLVFDQPDSLKPAADAYRLPIQKSGWLNRDSKGEDPVSNPRLIRELFDDEVLKNGRNTRVVEVAPGVLAAARLLEHQPALLSPFDDVKDAILSLLREEKAQALAVEEGEAKLAEAENMRVSWGKSQTVSRVMPGLLHPLALDAILRVGADNLPAYAGVALPEQGYAIYKILKAGSQAIEPEFENHLAQQIEFITAQNETAAYLAALRQRYKVKVNESLIREQEQ